MRRSILLSLLVLSLLVVGVPVAAQDLGAISGTITDADTGEPIEGVHVAVSGPEFMDLAWTDADGSYLIANVAPGWYRVGAGYGVEPMPSPWVGGWYDGRDSWETADQVLVEAGETVTGMDIQLVLGGVIRGVVTNSWTGDPIADILPSIEVNDPTWGWMQMMTFDSTDADGEYRIEGLSGEYRVVVWHNEFVEFTSPSMLIEPRTETTYDFTLIPASGSPHAMISGRACLAVDCHGPDGDSAPLSRREVVATRPDGTVLGTTTTDAYGWFHFEGLEPGSIVVTLADPIPGTALAREQRLDIGPNEGVWDVNLGYSPIPVHFSLTVEGPVESLTSDEVFEAVFELAITEPAEPFPVSDVAVSIGLSEGIELVRHTSDGPFDRSTLVWTATPSYGQPSALTLELRGSRAGDFLVTGEVQASRWPDPTATFGDGQGDDAASLEIVVFDQSVADPIQPGIVGRSSIEGVVFGDEDSNGRFDADEAGLSDVEIVLVGSDLSLAPVTSNRDGRFEAADVPAGSYRLEVTTIGDLSMTTPEHLITLAPETKLGGVMIGLAETSQPISTLWWILGATVLAAGMAAGGYHLGRRQRPPLDVPTADREPARSGV